MLQIARPSGAFTQSRLFLQEKSFWHMPPRQLEPEGQSVARTQSTQRLDAKSQSLRNGVQSMSESQITGAPPAPPDELHTP